MILVLKNYIIRWLILILTALPFILITVNTRLIKRIFGVIDIYRDSPKTYFYTVMYNIIEDLIYDIDPYLEEFKINFEKHFYILNPKDLILPDLKNLNNMGNAIKIIQRLTNGSSIIINHDSNLITKKSHISRFMNLKNGEMIFVNETSKHELYVWDPELNKFIPLKLKYWHKGSLKHQYDTHFTNNILVDRKNVRFQDIIIKFHEISNSNVVNHNASLAFLLNQDEPILHYEETIDNDEHKILKIALTENFWTTYDYINNNKELFDPNVIIAFEETKEFIEINSSVLSSIPEEDRFEFLKKCINIKTDIKKNIIFYFLKK